MANIKQDAAGDTKLLHLQHHDIPFITFLVVFCGEGRIRSPSFYASITAKNCKINYQFSLERRTVFQTGNIICILAKCKTVYSKAYNTILNKITIGIQQNINDVVGDGLMKENVCRVCHFVSSAPSSHGTHDTRKQRIVSQFSSSVTTVVDEAISSPNG